MSSAYSIERGVPSHAERLREIERAAGAMFRDVGMGDVADHDPTDASYLEECANDGRLLVALAPAGEVAGFLIWSYMDGNAYVEEVAVHPRHAGHRLAARLIDALADAVRGSARAITLATFREVPWNAPYYAKLGFEELSRSAVGREHIQAWQEQADMGLDMSKRLFMIRRVTQ